MRRVSRKAQYCNRRMQAFFNHSISNYPFYILRVRGSMRTPVRPLRCIFFLPFFCLRMCVFVGA